MIKTFLILLSFKTFLFASQQIILVVSEDFQSKKAMLECYEDSKIKCGSMEVNLGQNGLGWGIGEVPLMQRISEPHKREGDKKAPAGVFKLTDIYGYNKKSNLQMPYLYASKELICVDDSDSMFYNQIIQAKGNEKSFEMMKKEDHRYELGIVVAHNKMAKKEDGSCIFLHVKLSEDEYTSGCTAMNLDEITKIIQWLDKSKNPLLIQIPKSSSAEIKKLYPQLEASKLLK